MDIFDICASPYTDGRATASALAAMGIRAVITPDGLQLLSTPSAMSPEACLLGANLQSYPRDERGRFVAHWVLSLEILNDIVVLEDEYGFDDDLG